MHRAVGSRKKGSGSSPAPPGSNTARVVAHDAARRRASTPTQQFQPGLVACRVDGRKQGRDSLPHGQTIEMSLPAACSRGTGWEWCNNPGLYQVIAGYRYNSLKPPNAIKYHDVVANLSSTSFIKIASEVNIGAYQNEHDRADEEEDEPLRSCGSGVGQFRDRPHGRQRNPLMNLAFHVAGITINAHQAPRGLGRYRSAG
jgi:hypothetical protein